MQQEENKSLFGLSRHQIATAIAVLFHAIGLIGILYFDKQFFINTTALNLLLMFALIIYTQEKKNLHFYIFIFIAIAVGISVELIGTQTGLLFGNYEYGKALGPAIKNVPWVIGINWFMIIYCCGISMKILLQKITTTIDADINTRRPILKTLSVIIDGATLAVVFDWLMEPVAIQLGYWKWSGDIPVFNYACWFLVSLILLLIFHVLKFDKTNKFAVDLLLIQAMFFLLLRTFL